MSNEDRATAEGDRTEVRDAYFAKVREEDDRLVRLVLGATLVPDELTTTVSVKLAEPVDFEDRRGKLRLLEVRARVTRFLGERPYQPDEDNSLVYVRVDGYVHPLTAAGEPHARRDPYWTHLPDDLAGRLLGMAMTAP